MLGFCATITSIKISNTYLSLHKQLIMSDNVRLCIAWQSILYALPVLFAWNEIRKYSKKRNCNSILKIKNIFPLKQQFHYLRQSSAHGCNKDQVCNMRVQFRFAYQGDGLIDVIIDLAKYVLDDVIKFILTGVIKFMSWVIER